MRALLLPLLLTGCAALPNRMRVEVEHVSHPLAGWPCGRQSGSEDGLSQVSAIAAWRGEHAYMETGLGYNLEGIDGGGIHGPSFMGTVRVGYEWSLRK
jgi:hypothetical protein